MTLRKCSLLNRFFAADPRLSLVPCGIDAERRDMASLPPDASHFSLLCVCVHVIGMGCGVWAIVEAMCYSRFDRSKVDGDHTPSNQVQQGNVFPLVGFANKSRLKKTLQLIHPQRASILPAVTHAGIRLHPDQEILHETCFVLPPSRHDGEKPVVGTTVS